MSTAADGHRSTPRVAVFFSQTDRVFFPLDPIEVRYEVDGLDDDPPLAVEHSVLWFTEGKGEEDIGVHFFERVREPAAASLAGELTCRLPPSPLSYEGLIVKIRWCVRIRMFFEGGRDFVSEHIFELGHVPAAAFPGSS